MSAAARGGGAGMTVVPVRTGDTVSVALSGLLTFQDHEAGDRLVDDVAAALEDEGAALVRIDLERVEALDSHWLGVLIRMLRKARARGVPMEMVRPSPDVRRLLEVVEFDRVLTIID